jgi:hypothetical protein
VIYDELTKKDIVVKRLRDETEFICEFCDDDHTVERAVTEIKLGPATDGTYFYMYCCDVCIVRMVRTMDADECTTYLIQCAKDDYALSH